MCDICLLDKCGLEHCTWRKQVQLTLTYCNLVYHISYIYLNSQNKTHWNTLICTFLNQIPYYHFIGILKAAARTYFKKSLGLRLQSISHEEIGSDTTFEHVVFSVTCVDYNQAGDGAPTLVAETRKHAERQILKDVRIIKSLLM